MAPSGAVVRDLHSGVEATRLMSLLMLVFSISPLLAPLTGSFVTVASVVIGTASAPKATGAVLATSASVAALSGRKPRAMSITELMATGVPKPAADPSGFLLMRRCVSSSPMASSRISAA